MSVRPGGRWRIAAAGTALAAAMAFQVGRDQAYPRRAQLAERLLYLPSGPVLKRLVLEFDALAADIYWIRAIQHYGGDRLSDRRDGRYELLFPLLDITTTLDPYFTIAYRFGAIFLSEPYPGGPGRSDHAIALLRKGIAAEPAKWQYYHDIAFVHYWHLRDFHAAAAWFTRAASQPGAPNWLQPMAAAMLTAGGDRASARFLWQQLLQSDQPWLRRSAERRLLQLDALDQIDGLRDLVRRFPPPEGEPYSWAWLIRRRVLPGVPLDPARTPYDLDPVTGQVSVSSRSELYPMPSEAMKTLS